MSLHPALSLAPHGGLPHESTPFLILLPYVWGGLDSSGASGAGVLQLHPRVLLEYVVRMEMCRKDPCIPAGETESGELAGVHSRSLLEGASQPPASSGCYLHPRYLHSHPWVSDETED